MANAPLSRRSVLTGVAGVAATVVVGAGVATTLAGPASAASAVRLRPRRLVLSVGGTRVIAYHWQGASRGPRPILIMGQGLGGVQAVALPQIAPRFAEAGYDVLTFDYRFWGESGGRTRQVIDIPTELADWQAVIAYARTLPGVDPRRIALWGTSLGGGHVLTLGGKNLPGVSAVISQVPHVSGPASSAASDPANVPWLTAKAAADVAAAAAGKAPVYIPIVGAPGTKALLTQPSALPGYREVGSTFLVNRVAARLAAQLPLYNPKLTACLSKVPTFIAVADQDELCPPGIALDLARLMGAESKVYSGGHFDGYPPRAFAAPLLADELAFLQRVLPVTR